MCKLKLHLVLQLITWAEMELHIITSEHEVLNTLLPPDNSAPDLDTFSTFDHAPACCPSAPVFSSGGKGLLLPLCLDTTVPPGIPSEMLCLPTTYIRSGVLWCEDTPSDRVHCGQGDFSSSAQLPVLFSRSLQSSPLKSEQKVLPLLGQGSMMIMIGYFFPVFSPPP